MRQSTTPPPEGTQEYTLGFAQPAHSAFLKDLIYDEDTEWDWLEPNEHVEALFGLANVRRFVASGGQFVLRYDRQSDKVRLRIWARHDSQRWLTVFGFL